MTQDVQEIIASQGAAVKVVILGTRGYGDRLLRIPRAHRNFDVIAVVDDTLAAGADSYEGAALISSDGFRALARQHCDLIAVNTCQRLAPKAYFSGLCRECGVAGISLGQAIDEFNLLPLISPEALELRMDDGAEYRLVAHPGEESALVPKATLDTLLRESLLLRKKAAEINQLQAALSSGVKEAGDAPAAGQDNLGELFYRSIYDFDGLRTNPKVVHNHDFMRDPAYVSAYARALKATGGEQQIYWRVHVALWCAAHALRLDGDFVECGVWKGLISSAIMDYFDWNSLERRFFLFDTFRGLDESQLSDAEILKGNVAHFRHAYQDDIYESVKANFSEWRNVAIVRGSVPDSLRSVQIDKVAYLSIDMNNAAPEIAAMDHFYDKLVPGAVVLLDDYGFVSYEEQKIAWDKWSLKHSMPILALPTGQGMLIKPIC